jgi:hypothetical protein
MSKAMDLDAHHNQAIRSEIADRLRASLSREPITVPPRLRQLVWQLDLPNGRRAPGAAGLAGRTGGWLHRLLKRS